MKIGELLARSSEITAAFEKLNGRWSPNEQIAHWHSEVSEVFQAIKNDEGRGRIMEEIADAGLAWVTMCNLLEVSGEELEGAIEAKLMVIKARLIKMGYDKNKTGWENWRPDPDETLADWDPDMGDR